MKTMNVKDRSCLTRRDDRERALLLYFCMCLLRGVMEGRGGEWGAVRLAFFFFFLLSSFQQRKEEWEGS